MATYKQLEQLVEASADYCQEMYLDYFNNFLTIEGFADWYGIGEKQAAAIISAGRKIHHQRVNERLTA